MASHNVQSNNPQQKKGEKGGHMELAWATFAISAITLPALMLVLLHTKRYILSIREKYGTKNKLWATLILIVWMVGSIGIVFYPYSKPFLPYWYPFETLCCLALILDCEKNY
jgi:hypothetical protein